MPNGGIFNKEAKKINNGPGGVAVGTTFQRMEANNILFDRVCVFQSFPNLSGRRGPPAMPNGVDGSGRMQNKTQQEARRDDKCANTRTS
mgnify:CR=1 FL=1